MSSYLSASEENIPALSSEICYSSVSRAENIARGTIFSSSRASRDLFKANLCSFKISVRSPFSFRKETRGESWWGFA